MADDPKPPATLLDGAPPAVPPAAPPLAAPPVVPPVPPAPPAPAVVPAAGAIVPEKYDFKLPSGSTLPATFVERTAAIARELGLGNDAAQKLLDRQIDDITQVTTAQQALLDAWKPGGTEWSKRDQEWRTAALADPAIGGSPEKLTASVAAAQQALAKYGNPELKAALNESGYGSHPGVLKFMAAIGRAMSEGTFVFGAPPAKLGTKSDAQTLYPQHYNPDGSPKA